MTRIKSPEKEFAWTAELAYVVGLLATDGCLSKDGRHIVMRSSEKPMLRTFKKCLNISNKIGTTKNSKTPSYRVQLSNVQLYRWLEKIGLSQAKTHTIGELQIPDEFFRDFLRGHLDGDGSIYGYIDRYNQYRGRTYVNQRIFTRFISASKIHIEWLSSKIKVLAGVHGALIEEKPHAPGRVSIWELKFAKKESVKLLNWIYYAPKIPCLKRKRILAGKLMNRIAKEKRRQYTRIGI